MAYSNHVDLHAALVHQHSYWGADIEAGAFLVLLIYPHPGFHSKSPIRNTLKRQFPNIDKLIA